jgi:hypothetical protein
MPAFRIDKNEFINNFINPISKIGEKCVIELGGDYAQTLVTDSTSTLFLFCNTTLKTNITETTKISINDINKFEKALSCITEEKPQFKLNRNNIEYNSPHLKFKYHLLEDGIIPRPTIDIKALDNLEINTSFNISKDKITQVLKNSSFTTDSNKIYIFSKDGAIHCELNDKTIPNLDCVEMNLTDTFSGEALQEILPLRIDWLRNFANLKFNDLNVRYNKQNHVIIFYIQTEKTTLKYIVSTLTK